MPSGEDLREIREGATGIRVVSAAMGWTRRGFCV